MKTSLPRLIAVLGCGMMLRLPAAGPCRALELDSAYIQLEGAVRRYAAERTTAPADRFAPGGQERYATERTTASADGKSCVEASLISFQSQGRTVPPARRIGAENPCDDFGGDLAYTPRYRAYVYANFNVPGTVDLDAFDQGLDARVRPEHRERVSKLQFAFVSRDWMKRRNNGEDGDAFLNRGGTIFFISERVLAEGRLRAVLGDFFEGLSAFLDAQGRGKYST